MKNEKLVNFAYSQDVINNRENFLSKRNNRH